LEGARPKGRERLTGRIVGGKPANVILHDRARRLPVVTIDYADRAIRAF
jgi:hypothetical protein